jgi:hypothetical protein
VAAGHPPTAALPAAMVENTVQGKVGVTKGMRNRESVIDED